MPQDFTLKQWVGWTKRLGRDLLPAARHGCLVAAQRGIQVVQDATRAAIPANPSGIGTGGAVNNGGYLRGWKSAATPNGARLFNDVSYSGVIEDGRRAGSAWPPRAAIVAWAKRRLGLSTKDAQQAAFPISRAIARRGLRARKVLGGVEDKIRGIAVEEIGKAIRAEMEKR